MQVSIVVEAGRQGQELLHDSSSPLETSQVTQVLLISQYGHSQCRLLTQHFAMQVAAVEPSERSTKEEAISALHAALIGGQRLLVRDILRHQQLLLTLPPAQLPNNILRVPSLFLENCVPVTCSLCGGYGGIFTLQKGLFCLGTASKLRQVLQDKSMKAALVASEEFSMHVPRNFSGQFP